MQSVSGLAEILQNVSNVGAATRTADLWPQLSSLSERLGAQSILVIANKDTDGGWIPKVLSSDSPIAPDLSLDVNEFQNDPLFLRAMSDTAAIALSDVLSRDGLFSRHLESLAAGGNAFIVPVGRGAQARGFVVFAGPNLELTPVVRALLFISAYAALNRVFDGVAQTEPVADDAASHQLTAREIDCVRWLSAGLSNVEISLRLGISPRTVRFHIDNAKVKLGATSRIQLVLKALRE